jgi:hypothetical protein
LRERIWQVVDRGVAVANEENACAIVRLTFEGGRTSDENEENAKTKQDTFHE